MRNEWGITYEEWEAVASPATGESVHDALAAEAAGWPWPISGDETARLRRTGADLRGVTTGLADPAALYG